MGKGKIIHRVTHKGKIHGWHLANVQADCKEILTQASPVSSDALRFGVMCKACFDCEVPEGHNVIHVRESDGNAND